MQDFIWINSIDCANYDWDWYSYDFWDKRKSIDKLRKVNIFLWPNNSGKSRFLRNMFADKDLKYETLWYDELLKDIEFFYQQGEEKVNKYKNKQNEVNIMQSLVEQVKGWQKNIYVSWWENINSNSYKYLYDKISAYKVFAKNQGVDIMIPEKNQKIYDKYLQWIKHIYIPILRWLALDGTKADLYHGRVTRNHFQGKSIETKDIFTWNVLYTEIRKMLLWNHKERDLVRNYEKWLSKHFFATDISITPQEWNNNDVICIKIGDDEDKKIYELGDGIQSIILSTFPLFKYGKDMDVLLFIEEPELYMHPWYQRKLVELYSCDEFPKAQIFLTTHSNHFLDVLLDYEDRVSIYTVQKKDKTYHINNMWEETEVLDLLWVKNSSVFLANCVIWVEWISDRLYIRKFLELYKKSLSRSKELFSFEEDKHYTFAEYGWWNIAHMDFEETDNADNQQITSISNRNFLLCDNDWFFVRGLAGSAKAQRLKKLKLSVWDENFFADHREIENLISFECFNKYCDTYLWNSEIEKKPNPDKKDFNKQIISKWIWEVLKSIFIKKKESKNPKYFWNKDVACLWKDKLTIAKRMLDLLDELWYVWLPKTGKKLVSSLVKFIIKHNSG